MPGRPRRADRLGPRSLRGDGRADLHRRRLRGRRRDRHAGERRPRRPASRWPSSPATRTSFSWSATASASTTRATRAPGSTTPASRRSSASRRSRSIDVLALMGDSIDNVKGVPGIGEKGARDLIATYRLARRAAGARRRGVAEEVPRGLETHADEARQSRELVKIRTDVDVRVRSRGVPLPGPRRASAATRCSPRSASGRSSPSSRRPPTRSRRTTRSWTASRSSRRWWPSRCGAPAASRSASWPTAPSRVRASLIGLVFSTAPRHARYVPLGHEGFCGEGVARSRRALALLRAGARGPVDPQGRPRPQGRPGRARPRTASSSTGSTSTRCSRAT